MILNSYSQNLFKMTNYNQMKKTRACLGILVMLVFFVSHISCEETLELEPQDRQDLSIDTPSDAEGLLLGVYYATFREFQQLLMSDLPQSANELYQRNNIPNRVFNYRPAMRADNDGGASSYWFRGYEAISRANFVIDNIGSADPTAFAEGSTSGVSRQDEILAEARFLRGYIYYHLAKLYGDVPLIEEFPTSSNPGANDVERTPINEVKEFYINDFQFAERLLPWNHNDIRDFADTDENGETINSKGRATKGAAKLMLAKIQMEDQNWQQAISLVDDIINSGEFELVEDYNTMFTTTLQNTSESIWEVQTFNPGFNNQGGYIFRVGNPNLLSAPPEKYNLFEGDENNPIDYRQAVSMRMVDPDNPETLFRAIKFIPRNADGTTAFDDPTNFVLLRLADALLLKAEALNEIGYPNDEALGIINTLRARTSGNFEGLDYPGVDPGSFDDLSDQNTFRQFIRDERARELMFEAHQYYDLLRYDSYDGGNLIFTDQNRKEIKRLKLGKGSIVFFPSNFMYPHGIQPITKGTRYSIVAWLQ